MNLFYIAIYLVWLISEIILNRLLRSGKEDKKLKGKHSLTYVWVTVIIANTIAALISYNTYFPIVPSAATGMVGIALIILGMIIRFIAIASLGRLFTVDVAIRTGHTIKTDGMYKYIRHPAYAGSLLSFLGFGISLNNWISLLVVLIPVTTVFLYRIRVEETLLSTELGAVYNEYKKHTKRLIPGIY